MACRARGHGAAQRSRPLKEWAEIIQKLSSRGQAELYTAVLDSLEVGDGSEIHEDRLKEFYILQMTDEQLFAGKRSRRRTTRRTDFYEQLVEALPPAAARLPEALFMIGARRAAIAGRITLGRSRCS